MGNSKLVEQIKKLKEKQYKELTSLLNTCNHKFDDGKSAVNKHFQCNICTKEVITLEGLDDGR
jgi:hypothetical protein